MFYFLLGRDPTASRARIRNALAWRAGSFRRNQSSLDRMEISRSVRLVVALPARRDAGIFVVFTCAFPVSLAEAATP